MTTTVWGLPGGQEAQKGDFGVSWLGDRTLFGLVAIDHQGPLMCVLADGDDTEAVPHLMEARHLDTIWKIEAEVIIEPLRPFALMSTEAGPGSLVMGPAGQVGIVSAWSESPSPMTWAAFDVRTGDPMNPRNGPRVGDWRLLVTRPGGQEPYELARFGG